jgi:hypothetical protein
MRFNASACYINTAGIKSTRIKRASNNARTKGQQPGCAQLKHRLNAYQEGRARHEQSPASCGAEHSPSVQSLRGGMKRHGCSLNPCVQCGGPQQPQSCATGSGTAPLRAGGTRWRSTWLCGFRAGVRRRNCIARASKARAAAAAGHTKSIFSK